MESTEQSYVEFEQHAHAFIDCILDDAVTGTAGLLVLRKRLLALYVSATKLPEVDYEEMEAIKDVESRIAEWSVLYRSLPQRLPVNVYRLVFNPLDNEEAITYALSGDLSEIWMDLDAAMRLKERNGGKFQAEMWWHWRFDFTSHWGMHAMNALRVMHEVIEQEHLS